MAEPSVVLDEPDLAVSVRWDEVDEKVWFRILVRRPVRPEVAILVGGLLTLLAAAGVFWWFTHNPDAWILFLLTPAPIVRAIIRSTRRTDEGFLRDLDEFVADRRESGAVYLNPFFRFTNLNYIGGESVRKVFEVLAPVAKEHGIRVIDRLWENPEYRVPEDYVSPFVTRSVEQGEIPPQKDHEGWRCETCSIVNFEEPEDPEEKGMCWGCEEIRFRPIDPVR